MHFYSKRIHISEILFMYKNLTSHNKTDSLNTVVMLLTYIRLAKIANSDILINNLYLYNM
jgi:hypothetical protein